jgi:16S rRNA C967 or C1407 C5-methylase (RsmB/RsmF family)/NOL1/NOP2/fmu family ribosome biogenesis protein
MNSLVNVEGFDREAFEKIHQSGEQVTSIRVNPAKKSEIRNPKSKIPWTEFGYYLQSRPSFTFDPLFHAGCYYVQEASGMFLEQALKQTVDLSNQIRILDLAAAPGGKSTHIQSLITKDSLLVSNEVIKSRANILQDNMIKWGSENVVVTNNDPKDFARLENYFDVIVVDAPCSGSGLFRKDEEAISEWSLNNVQLCSQRQQRILADVWPALKKNGVLIYSTCSYSREEDEEIAQRIRKQFAAEYLELKIEDDWKITKTVEGYKFWPYNVKGEGFFIACFKKIDGEEAFRVRSKSKLRSFDKKQIELVGKWLKNETNAMERQFVEMDNSIYAISKNLTADINLLSEKLRVNYFGVRLGEWVHDKLIPDHALAMSNLVSEQVDSIDLNLADAITYLKKKELRLSELSKGWKLVKYEGQNLGWINVLANRVNNYYPKELRILKDI